MNITLQLIRIFLNDYWGQLTAVLPIASKFIWLRVVAALMKNVALIFASTYARTMGRRSLSDIQTREPSCIR